MAKWTGVITNAGNNLLNAWVGEKTLRFDCAKAGTGTVEIAALMAQTDLVSNKQDAHILNAESVNGGIRLKIRVTASEEGYLLNQFGVWASVDGNTALIAIFQHENGVSVPSIDESPDFVFTFYGLIMTSNTGTWTVNIDTSALVTTDDMNTAIAETAKKYLPLSGGKMAGDIDMQGKAISGLNDPTEGTQASPKSYVDKRIPLDGSKKMTGDLQMGGHKVTSMAEPTDGTDAATKEYADKMLPKTGGTMTGAIAMGGYKVTGLGDPTDAADAATKSYADLAAYPVGAIYISTVSTSPASLFGGTWAMITNRFLLAAGDLYEGGTTGGEAEHTLTIAEMPSHMHEWQYHYLAASASTLYATGWSSQKASSGNTTYTGGDQPHNNMPPYFAVYMWQRVA